MKIFFALLLLSGTAYGNDLSDQMQRLNNNIEEQMNQQRIDRSNAEHQYQQERFDRSNDLWEANHAMEMQQLEMENQRLSNEIFGGFPR